MTFVLPTANNLHDQDPDGGSQPRHLVNINTPSTVTNKAQGNLPITQNAGQWNNDTNGATKGIGYEFQASQAGYDVSSDTKVMLWHNQHNAPNRIQVDTAANAGVELRIYSGTGSMPTNYRAFYVGGNNTPNSECIKGQYPYIIDLNDTSNDASNGTFDNTDVTSYAILTTRLNLAGTSTNWNYMGKLYILDTTKSSSNTPTFSGSGATALDAVTLIQGTDYTDKLGNWVRKIGDVMFIDMGFRIGNNSSITTFDDEGITVISPVANDSNDPRVRVTTQAFRTYLNLRNNAADTATFSGTWIWQVRSPFDWDQDDGAVVTFNSPTFKGMGAFTVGSSISGDATFDDVDTVIMADTGVDLDGSTFKNQNSTHALQLGGAMTIADMRFENYASAHAIEIDTAGSYTFDNLSFDGSGTNDVENTSGGLVTITLTNNSDIPTITNTGGGSTTTIVNNKTLTVTVKDTAGAAIASASVDIREDDDAGALIAQGSTNGSGVYTYTTYNYTADQAALIRVRKSTSGTRYLPFGVNATITTNGLSLEVTLSKDNIVAA